MESLIGTALILAVAVFILYRTGIMRLAQTSTERLVSQTDKGLEAWEITNDEKRSKQFGKLKKKLSDEGIERSSASEIRKALKTLEATEDK